MTPDLFWSKVDKAGPIAAHMESCCWVWTGATTPTKKGGAYGQAWWNGRRVGAHRVAWELTNGPIPKGAGYHGTVVCHRCDVPSCVNPTHLFLGTQQDNLIDAGKKKASRSGRDWVPPTYLAETDETVLAAVRTAVEASGGPSALAKAAGVNPSDVCNTLAGRARCHNRLRKFLGLPPGLHPGRQRKTVVAREERAETAAMKRVVKPGKVHPNALRVTGYLATVAEVAMVKREARLAGQSVAAYVADAVRAWGRG